MQRIQKQGDKMSIREVSKATKTNNAPAAIAAAEHQAVINDLQIYLYKTLQTTLDLDKLLNNFFTQLQNLIGLAGIEFTGKQLEINVSVGSKALHSFQYQLSTRQQDVGELTCYSRNRVNGLNIEILEVAASTLIYPLYNAQNHQKALRDAQTDPLTSLGNRQRLDNTLSSLIASALRHQHPLSVLMIDIDHFKQINDSYGHSAGDQVIVEVAKTINQVARDADSAFRYGGEEFIVVLDNTDSEGAAIAAERLRKQVEKICTDETKNDTISVSIGHALLAEKENACSLIKRADAALYHAKTDGRNRVCKA